MNVENTDLVDKNGDKNFILILLGLVDLTMTSIVTMPWMILEKQQGKVQIEKTDCEYCEKALGSLYVLESHMEEASS